MKIFIAGGTGFVGEYLISELLDRGDSVRLLTHRRGSGIKNVEEIEGDAAVLESFSESLKGCDAVLNLVGIIREFPKRRITFERLHIQVTANLLTAAKQAGISRFIQMSALGTRQDAVSGYHSTKYQAEELVRSSGLSWTIFRPSLIFGAKDAFVNMLAAKLRLAPLMPVMGNGTYRIQPIAGEDVARCFAMSLNMPEAEGQIFELCGPERLTYLDLIDAIASALGKSPPFKPKIPLFIMKPLIRIMQRFSWFPITMDQLQMLLEENICDDCWKKYFTFEPIGFRKGINSYLSKMANL